MCHAHSSQIRVPTALEVKSHMSESKLPCRCWELNSAQLLILCAILSPLHNQPLFFSTCHILLSCLCLSFDIAFLTVTKNRTLPF